MLKRSFAPVAVLAVGLALAGCDKCGNWFGQASSSPQVCKEDLPR